MLELDLTNNSTVIILASVLFAVALVSVYLFKFTPSRRASTPTNSDLQSQVRSIKHVTVILNPYSGSGAAEKIFNSVQPTLKDAGLSMTTIETTEKGHAYRIANQISQQECDGIICVGGDGLVHEVVNGLLNRSDATIARHISLGIIPAGTTNSLASSLGINNPQDAAVRIISSRVRPLDIIGVVPLAPPTSPQQQPQPMLHSTLYSVAFLEWGLCSEVEALADRISWLRGLKRYVAVLITLISSVATPKYVGNLSFLPASQTFTIPTICYLEHPHCEPCESPMQSVKGKRPTTDLKGWVVADGILNDLAFFVAGNVPCGLTPFAHLSDGYLDVAIVERCSRFELAKLLLAKGAPTKYANPPIIPPTTSTKRHVRYYKTSSLRLDIDRSVPLSIDGEFLEPPDGPGLFMLNVEVNRGLCLVIC